MTTVLIIGASGLVGSRFVTLSRNHSFNLLTPSHTELDVCNEKSTKETITKYNPHVVINFSAIINIDNTEKERNNKQGKAWLTNVLGASHLVNACEISKAFLIQISTDAVFPGSKDDPGPYKETHRPAHDGKGLNWYGYTKMIAEQKVQKLENSAIVRISHPFGNFHSNKDLVQKTIQDIQAGHKFLINQRFTPTYIDDLTYALWKIIEGQKRGIFHVSCPQATSRFIFAQYIAQKLKINTISSITMEEFLSQPERAIRAQYGGLDSAYTQKILKLSFRTWQDVLKNLSHTSFIQEA